MNRYIKIIIFILIGSKLFGQITYDRIEPPFWWTGMKDTTLQLMIHGDRIAESSMIVDHKLVKAVETRRVENPNYLFVNLVIPGGTKAGKVKLVFQYQREILFKVDYELKERAEGSAMREGFGKARQHCADVWGKQGCFAGLGGPEGAADALQPLANSSVLHAGGRG